MQYHPSNRNIVWTVLLLFCTILSFNGCSDANNVTGPPGPAAPEPLSILTSSPLPAGATGMPYNITLAPGGGTPPYIWSLVPGSPSLPNGLTLNPSTGSIVGTPTATGTTATVFKLQDSNGESVQKSLPITVNYYAWTFDDSHTLTSIWHDQPALQWCCLKRDWWQITLHLGYY